MFWRKIEAYGEFCYRYDWGHLRKDLNELKDQALSIWEKCFKQQEHEMEKSWNLLAVLKAQLGDK